MTGNAVLHEPTADEIRAQLDRILRSPEFSVPDRAQNFLKYVVAETLAGRPARIKAYSIALEVFDRGDSFDGQSDPVVRIEAGRLRRALERYYLVSGQLDPIAISIPKGAYVPVFAWRNADKSTSAQYEEPIAPPSQMVKPQPARPKNGAAVPALMVAHFRDAGNGPEAKLHAIGICDELINALSHFNEVAVFDCRTSSNAVVSPDPGRITSWYLIDGSVRIAGSHVRVTAHVVDVHTSEVLWSQAFDDDSHAGDAIKMQERIAVEIATIVAQPYGIAFQAETKRLGRNASQDGGAYACMLRAYQYRRRPTSEGHAEVRRCLEAVVAATPRNATANALLSLVYLDEIKYMFNRQPEAAPAVERALEAARRALEIEPENVRAMQALMMALFFARRVEEALRVGERALQRNRNDPELLGEYGTRVVAIGDWRRGRALLEEALAHDAGYANFYRMFLAYAAYMQGDVDTALAEIRRADLVELPLFNLFAAIVYSEKSLIKETALARDKFLEDHPTFFDEFDAHMELRSIPSADQQRLIRGAVKAGFPVPRRLIGGRVRAVD